METKLSDQERFIIQSAYNQLGDNHYDCNQAWERVKRCTNPTYKLHKKIRILSACVLICLFISGSSYYFIRYESSQTDTYTQYPEIQKGQGLPVLTLSDGRQFPLRAESSQQISQQAETELVIDSLAHTIQYLSSHSLPEESVIQYHTLEIPKGGEYTLILADGSRVWLNSESTLRFPVKFGTQKREITLSGEIYLEVTPDSLRPFYVHTGQQTIQVLGTRFNVRNYPTDQVRSTTLVEGKVQIISNNTTYILHPGEHYVESANGGEPKITTVNTDFYTSWINGKIIFRDERLEEIIKQLQRWYDFEIFYAQPELKDLHFGGAINKYNSFNVVLNYLERTANIRFEIHDKTVIVQKSKIQPQLLIL